MFGFGGNPADDHMAAHNMPLGMNEQQASQQFNFNAYNIQNIQEAQYVGVPPPPHAQMNNDYQFQLQPITTLEQAHQHLSRIQWKGKMEGIQTAEKVDACVKKLIASMIDTSDCDAHRYVRNAEGISGHPYFDGQILLEDVQAAAINLYSICYRVHTYGTSARGAVDPTIGPGAGLARHYDFDLRLQLICDLLKKVKTFVVYAVYNWQNIESLLVLSPARADIEWERHQQEMSAAIVQRQAAQAAQAAQAVPAQQASPSVISQRRSSSRAKVVKSGRSLTRFPRVDAIVQEAKANFNRFRKSAAGRSAAGNAQNFDFNDADPAAARELTEGSLGQLDHQGSDQQLGLMRNTTNPSNLEDDPFSDPFYNRRRPIARSGQ